MSAAENMTSGLSVEECAAYWVMRLGAQDCGPADRAAFEAWRRESPDHEAAWRRAEGALSAVDAHIGHPQLDALTEEVLRDTEPRRASRWPAVAAAAAVFVTLVGVTAFVLDRDLVGAPEPDDVIVAEAPVDLYQTMVGERSSVVLTDGTTLSLNTNSRVEVRYSAARRDIRLLQGQALFEVASAPDRPFVVQAGDRRIVALGTEFDVRYDDAVGVQVTLLEGLVAIDGTVEPLDAVENPPNPVQDDAIELVPGEQFSVQDEAISVEAANLEETTSWRHGRLVFRDRPLVDVIAEVNRYTTTPIILDSDPRLARVRVSGVFDAGRTASFVLAMETLHPVHFEPTEDGGRTILRWQG